MAAPATLGQSWSIENADRANTGQLERATPGGVDGSRLIELDSDVITQPVEGPAGLALAGTLDGRVVALDANGDTVWSADVGGPMRTAPAWTGEVVVAMPRAGQAVGLTATGERAWTVPIGNDRQEAGGDDILFVRLASPTVTASGDAVLADLDGTVQRVLPDGRVLWSHDVHKDYAVEATPAIGPNGNVIVTAFLPNQEGQGTLALLASDSGDPIWQVELGSQVVGATAVVDGRILVPLRDGDAVQSRALRDGSLQWETAFDDHVPVSPTVHEDLVIAGDIRGVTRAMRLSDGAEAWTFNPTGDDQDLGQITSGGVLTVADSPAVDADGRLWLAYWNADMSTCCPPTRSLSSPFYLLDAETGERLDRDRFPGAAHGPGLHETGVWAGSDEGGVRHWARPGTLRVHAAQDGPEVTLLTNTDHAGDWTITWGGEATDEGSDRPPATTTHTFSTADRHTITVEVGDARASTTVRVTDDQIQAGPSEDDATTSGPGTPGSNDAATGDTDGTDGSTAGDPPRASGGEQTIPIGPLALVATALAAAWRRRRA